MGAEDQKKNLNQALAQTESEDSFKTFHLQNLRNALFHEIEQEIQR